MAEQPPDKKKATGKDVVPVNVTDAIGADAARTALARSISAHGWTLDGGEKWVMSDPSQAAATFHANKLLPGDAITICTATGPRCGRVGTVIFAEGEYLDAGSAWIASASGPQQQIVVEKILFEASPRDFDPTLKDGKKPLQTWRAGEARPSKGHAWVIGLQKTSKVQRAKLDALSDGARSKLKIGKGDAEVTPGTVLSRAAKLKAGDPTIANVPFSDDPKALPGKSKANSSGPALPTGPLTNPNPDDIPPPVQIDAHTVQIRIGTHAGRVGFTVQKPGAKKPTSPAATSVPKLTADGKRDAFIQAAMSFTGTPFLAGSIDPAKGLDGVGLISICLRRVGAIKKDADPLTAASLHGQFPHVGGTADPVPDEILPGDVAWFGSSSSHDVDAQQHPMIFLGGNRVLGPIADAGSKGSAVQVIHIAEMPEHFAGWTHLDDLGTDTTATEHPGSPATGTVTSAALLPAGPAPRYDALKKLAADQKATWLDDKGKVNLIGVKNMHDRSVILPKDDDWNDTLFAAYLDEDGNKCCLELRASINPGTDKVHDGTWQLVDGSYTFKLAAGDGVDGQSLKPDGEVKGWFDEHGAGIVRPGDLKADAEANPSATTTAAPAGSDSSADSSDSSADSSTTSAPAESTTVPAGTTTTASPAETTTGSMSLTTTASPGETTTAVASDTTTAAPNETTTAQPATTTTLAPESTSTAAPASTTTSAPSGATTAPSGTTTAAANGTTTAAPGASTTAAPGNATTAGPAQTTTAAPAQTTTAAPAQTTTKAPNNGKVSSSNISVNGKHFADWFNGDFRPQYPGNHPTLQLWKKPAPMFPSNVNKVNFNTVFDNVQYLWADQITVPEFLGFFGIFYNETGGTFKPVGEQGGQKYCFQATKGGKASYNKSPNRLAGDQLKAMGAISDPNDVAAWNSTTYPANAPPEVIAAAANCDFYKYRGHGFIQTTWRNNYQRDVDPALQAAGYPKTCDDMTGAELEAAILGDPKVNLAMVKSFFKAMGNQFSKVNQDPPVWYDTGRAVSGQKPYGDLYQWRCQTIYDAMKKAGFELK